MPRTFYIRLFLFILALGDLGYWSRWVWSAHLLAVSLGPFARELTCQSGTWAYCGILCAVDGRYCDAILALRNVAMGHNALHSDVVLVVVDVMDTL